MGNLIPPTGQQLADCFFEELNEDFELIHETTSPARHGYAYVLVFKRNADGSFWKVHGRSASDNDFNTLRDVPQEVTPILVVPQQRTITEYVAAAAQAVVSALVPPSAPSLA